MTKNKFSAKSAENQNVLHQILEINQENRYLSKFRGFLRISEGSEKIAEVPLSDIAVLLVTAQGCVFSKDILNALSENGAVSVLCGRNYVPQSIVHPVSSHCRHAGILRLQIEASAPLQKNLWKKIVEKKLFNQALVAESENPKIAKTLRNLSKNVKSGDSDNREGVGARFYFSAVFGSDFVRDQDGDGTNALLNYGYAVMRASMCRAVCAAGLNPSLGMHHDNALNAFCLADDLFEIYRPIVDWFVLRLLKEGETELSPEVKKILADALFVKVETAEGLSPAFQSMQYLAQSFVRSLREKNAALEIPEWKPT